MPVIGWGGELQVIVKVGHDPKKCWEPLFWKVPWGFVARLAPTHVLSG